MQRRGGEGGLPQALRSAAAVLVKGTLVLSLVSAIAIQSIGEAKRKEVALSCRVCRGKGFYVCKLCKGNSTIEWSPLYDPLVINLCLCPTCEGNRVQRCLNCLGKGYC